MVKRIMPDGSDCPKCKDVMAILKARGLANRIDRVLAASPESPQGDGMQLARRLQVRYAPFFVIEEEDGSETVYTSVLKMIKEVLCEPGPLENCR
jgi:hypothetical protein